jgi:hypothetical protein
MTKKAVSQRPGERELRRQHLPDLVAFASHHARRAQPAFRICWPGAGPEHIEALQHAGLLLEKLVAGHPVRLCSLIDARVAVIAAVRAAEMVGARTAAYAADAVARACECAAVREIPRAVSAALSSRDSAERATEGRVDADE